MNKKRDRAQSAMEYLMTYGWSILLVAVVLGALFALGGFNTNQLSSSNTCLSQSGYSCTKVTLNSSGIMNVTVGQATGSQQTITAVGCSNTSAVPSSFSSITPVNLSSGQSTSILFQCPLPSGTIGSAFAGTLWIRYTSHSIPLQTSELGTVNAKASTSSSVGRLPPITTFAYVTNYGTNNVIFINTATNTVFGSINSGISHSNGVAFTPSGAYAYVTNLAASNIIIVNTSTSTVVNSITSGLSGPYGIAFTSSGAYAYVTNYYANNVVIINTATGKVVSSITGGFSYPAGISISPNGAYAYVANYGAYNVVKINTATNTVVAAIASLPGSDYPNGVTISPNGAYAYVPYGGSTLGIDIVNTSSFTVTSQITGGILTGSLYNAAFAPNAGYAYVTDYNNGYVVIINTSTSTVVGQINSAMSFPNGVAFYP